MVSLFWGTSDKSDTRKVMNKLIRCQRIHTVFGFRPAVFSVISSDSTSLDWPRADQADHCIVDIATRNSNHVKIVNKIINEKVKKTLCGPEQFCWTFSDIWFCLLDKWEARKKIRSGYFLLQVIMGYGMLCMRTWLLFQIII